MGHLRLIFRHVSLHLNNFYIWLPHLRRVSCGLKSLTEPVSGIREHWIFTFSLTQDLSKRVVVQDVSSQSKTLPSAAQPTVDNNNTITELAPTFDQTRDIIRNKAYENNCHARAVEYEDNNGTASSATTAPTPMTITPSNSCDYIVSNDSCDHIVSNDSCAIHQIPVDRAPTGPLLTHRNNKKET